MKKYLSLLFILLTVTFLICCKTVNQSNIQKQVRFKGKITFEIVTTIGNEEKFDKDLDKLIKKIDSVTKLSVSGDNIWDTYQLPTLKLILDPRQNNTNNIGVKYDYKFSDSTIIYKYKVDFSKFKVIISTNTNDYTKYNARNNKVINNKTYEFYNNDVAYDEKIYKDSVKVINGYKCYKVVITEKDNSKVFNDIIPNDILGNYKIYKEMYVTEDINTLYHPVNIRLELLKKYYPLEIKMYSSVLPDKISFLKTSSIETDK